MSLGIGEEHVPKVLDLLALEPIQVSLHSARDLFQVGVGCLQLLLQLKETDVFVNVRILVGR